MLELFELPVERVQFETKLVDDLGLDSIDAIDLAARLEELTHRRLGEDQLRSLRTVDDVVTLIQNMLETAPELATLEGLPGASAGGATSEPGEAKPAEAKPAEAKPAEAKPEEPGTSP
jgi:acyl carrier protein